jgi:hypothetical protein
VIELTRNELMVLLRSEKLSFQQGCCGLTVETLSFQSLAVFMECFLGRFVVGQGFAGFDLAKRGPRHALSLRKGLPSR